jgi:hypothetical protein
MRKLLCLLVSMLICISLTLPALAEESLFIPSYGLEAKKAEMNGEDVLDCVVVTSVTEAKEKSTDIAQEERDLLVEIYDALSDGTMALPAEGQCVELLDLSFALACRENADHNQKAEALKEAGVTLTVDFQLEIENHDQLMVFAYIDGKWENVEQVSANNDGIVTVTFEDICPVLFLAPEGDAQAGMDMPNVAPDFVPSITYKDGPAIDMAEMDGEGVEDCVVVTTIKQAKDKSTDISQEDRDLLLDVYEQLEEGTMTLPVEEDGYVIRELVDVSFEYEDCRQIEEHGHKDQHLKEEGVTLTVTFDLGVGTFEDVIILVYVDGEWVPVESVKNNGNGTVTAIFEDICPVAFVVKEKGNAQAPTTGDAMGNQLMLVMGMMVLSAAGVVALLTAKARKAY